MRCGIDKAGMYIVGSMVDPYKYLHRFSALPPPAGSHPAVFSLQQGEDGQPSDGAGAEEPAGGGKGAKRVPGRARDRRNLDAGDARSKRERT